MFVQSFGDTVNAAPEDVVTTMQFDHDGKYLAVGDRGGRVILFKRNTTKPKKPEKKSKSSREWMPYFQFQSHEAEFDYLKSLDIDEKLIQMKFFKNSFNDSQMMLTANEKAVKLFKIGHRSENYYNDSEENTNTNTNSDYSNHGSYEGPEIGSRNSYCRVGSNAVFPSYNSGPKSTDLKLPVNMNARNKSDAQQVYATNKRGFENAHVYNINSISIHSDGETFLSADDLRINTWNVERNSCCYNLIDIKPASMEELTEVITCAEYHADDSALCVYATSAGSIKVIDTRAKSSFDRKAATTFDATNHSCRIYHHPTMLDVPSALQSNYGSIPQSPVSSSFSRIAGATAMTKGCSPPPIDVSNTSFFHEMISSISDIRFTGDARFLLSRDFMTIKVWDLALTQYPKYHNLTGPKPVRTIQLHDHLEPYLASLYENDAIFDRFGMAISPDGKKVVTGSYSNQFNVFDCSNGNIVHSCEVGSNSSSVNRRNSDATGSSKNTGSQFYRSQSMTSPQCNNIDITKKVMNVSWCPDGQMVAVAGNAGLYIYKV